MNKKLEEGAESFKQFILDEYKQLEEDYQKLKSEYVSHTRRYDALQYKHQDLKALCQILTDNKNELSRENNRLLERFGNISKIELLEKQMEALVTSHSEVCKENDELKTRIHNLCDEWGKEVKDLKVVNTNLYHSNAKHITIANQLINFLDKLGYNVDVLPLKQNLELDTEYLKKLLGLKYRVEEVKPTEKLKEGQCDINTLKDLVVKGLGKNFHVEFNNGVKSDSRRGSKVYDGVKGSPVRDNKGRFAKK